MKLLLFSMFLVVTTLTFANDSISNIYGGASKEIILEDTCPFIKKIDYYNKSNILMKSEYHSNKLTIKEKGIVVQNNYYDENNVIVKFEMIYSDHFFDFTNINKRIEHVDVNDNITKIEYYNNNTLIEIEASDFQKFPFNKLYNHYKSIQDDYNEKLKNNNKNDSYIYDAILPRGKALVQYMNAIAPISKQEYDYFEHFYKSIKDEATFNLFKKLYTRKILVKENNITHWIFFQDQLFQYLKNNQHMVISYYFYGGLNNYVYFVSIGFRDVINP